MLGACSMRYFFAFAVFVTWSGISFGQAKPIDDAALRNAAKSASDGDWLSYGLTPGETRFSPLTQIDASNVKRLGLVWSYEVGEGGGDQ
jgi:glucose dehydrogenase